MATNANGAVIYSGPSRIDGAPIVCIVTGLSGKASANVKTGAMLQTWILRSDVAPLDALKNGADASICGGCPHRRKAITITKANGQTVAGFSRSCYVNVGQAPRSVWAAFAVGRYATLTLDQLAEATSGKLVRLGSYGDPAAVPLAVWEAYTRNAAGRTGYTHQWKSARLRDVLQYCQASADSESDLQKARALGAGTFRVAPKGSDALDGEIRCPASAEAGKVATCATCRMCDGASARNIVIDAHGSGAVYVRPAASRILTVIGA